MTTNLSYQFTSIPSRFPVPSRRIYVCPVAPMTYKTKDEAYPLMAAAIEKICQKRLDNILVHSVSFAFADYLAKTIKVARPIYTFPPGKPKERSRAIDSFKRGEQGILIAPALDRGIDFPGDECRTVVVPKIPYPSLADPQISAILYKPGGELWYSIETIRSLAQMTGRAMRSEYDYCESYILDTQFITLWRKSKNLLPSWFKDAVVMDEPKRIYK